MIDISIWNDGFHVEGHAKNHLVCTAISVLAYAALSALQGYAETSYEEDIDKGMIDVYFLDSDEKYVKGIMYFFKNGVLDLEYQFNNDVKVSVFEQNRV